VLSKSAGPLSSRSMTTGWLRFRPRTTTVVCLPCEIELGSTPVSAGPGGSPQLSRAASTQAPRSGFQAGTQATLRERRERRSLELRRGTRVELAPRAGPGGRAGGERGFLSVAGACVLAAESARAEHLANRLIFLHEFCR